MEKPGSGGKLEILSRVNLTIHRKRITALIGPSGAGKSSLLRLLNRLDDPSDGSVFLNARPLTSYDIPELRRRVGMVFQLPVIIPGTVAENLHLAARFAPKGRKLELIPVPELLTTVGLDPEFAGREAGRLSVGQQQRVSLARTLAVRPQAVLLDEPTASLDPESANAVMDLVRRLRDGLGLTVVLVTHLLAQARQYADYTGYLEGGRLIEFNETGALFDSPREIRTRQFLNGGGQERELYPNH